MNEQNKKTNLISQKKIANSYLFAILSFVILITFDQITKYMVTSNMNLYDSIPVIKDIFELHYIHNPGAAWGMFANKQTLFLICTIIVLIFGIFFYIRCSQSGHFKLLRIALVLILSGAVGNFIDRLRFQYVIDFLYFKLIDFPVFNVADCYVTIGFFVTIILILFVYKEEDFDILSKKPNSK